MDGISNSALRAQLGNSLRELQLALRTLADYLMSEAHEAWVWREPPRGTDAFSQPLVDLSRGETLARVAAGIQAIKYVDDQDVHESRIWPGVVAVSAEGIRLAEEANRHKMSLAQVLRAMEGRTESGTIDPETG